MVGVLQSGSQKCAGLELGGGGETLTGAVGSRKRSPKNFSIVVDPSVTLQVKKTLEIASLHAPATPDTPAVSHPAPQALLRAQESPSWRCLRRTRCPCRSCCHPQGTQLSDLLHDHPPLPTHLSPPLQSPHRGFPRSRGGCHPPAPCHSASHPSTRHKHNINSWGRAAASIPDSPLCLEL